MLSRNEEERRQKQATESEIRQQSETNCSGRKPESFFTLSPLIFHKRQFIFLKNSIRRCVSKINRHNLFSYFHFLQSFVSSFLPVY